MRSSFKMFRRGRNPQLVDKVRFRDICRDGSRPIRTSGRAQRIKSRRMARGFPVMSCFWQGSTERSRPFPTNQRKGCKGCIKSNKVYRQSECFTAGETPNLLFIISYLYQYTTLPHPSAPYISPSFWAKIRQYFSVSPVAFCLRCPYNRVITARALRMCFRSALFH